MVTKQDEKLSKMEEDVLAALYSSEEYCYNYSGLEGTTGITRKYLEPIIKRLKQLGLIEHWRGLMDDDGQVAGSGWCRSKAGNQYVEDHEL